MPTGKMVIPASAACVAVLLSGCVSSKDVPVDVKPQTISSHPAQQEPIPFVEMLRKIAREHEDYELVTWMAHQAPELCLPPPQTTARLSVARPGSPHGRKKYGLFVRDPSYKLVTADPQRQAPIGQTLVKSTFTPRVVGDAGFGGANERFPTDPDGELFIMTKLDPATPGTDQGWVYGVVSRDLDAVLVAGTVASCIECHRAAAEDRQYGPTARHDRSAPFNPRLPPPPQFNADLFKPRLHSEHGNDPAP